MRRTSILAAITFTVLAGAACSTTGSQPATTSPPASTTAPSEATTTSSDAGGTKNDPRLERALPTADEVGDGYEIADADGFPKQGDPDPRVEDECPALVATAEVPSARDVPHAGRTYEDGTGITVGLGLAELPPAFTADAVEEMIAAYQACTPFTLDDPRVGEVEYSVEALHGGYGDYGAVFVSTVAYAYQGQPIELEGQWAMFAVDDIAVAVSITNEPGPDGTVPPIPENQLRELALLMEQQAASL